MFKIGKNKKLIKSIFHIALLVIISLIIGLNIYNINSSRLVGDNVPMPFGIGSAVVLSGSMEPELSTGDLIFIVEKENYEVGDVIVYQDGKIIVTHRIISISEEEVITRGDANNTDDAPIKMEHIKGKVAFAIPLLGYLVNIIKTPIGTIVIIGLAVYLLERSFHSEKEKDKQKLADIKAEIEKLKQQK